MSISLDVLIQTSMGVRIMSAPTMLGSRTNRLKEYEPPYPCQVQPVARKTMPKRKDRSHPAPDSSLDRVVAQACFVWSQLAIIEW
jgi:hypothetical protein